MSARRILVTEAQDRGALAAIRSLSDAGYQVEAVGDSRAAPGLRSRACSRADVLAPVTEVEAHLAGLERILAARHFDVLIPGNDESLYLISRHRDRFDSLVTTGLPPHANVMKAFDKSELPGFAARAGVAVPAARICRQPDEAIAAADQFGYPVLVKPTSAVGEVDGRLIRHPSQLAIDEETVRKLQADMGECIVQDRVDGPVVSIAGVSTDRGVLGSVLARHLRVWPLDAGSASFVETLPFDAQLMARVDALVAAIGWRGLWQLQFIEDHHGVLHAIDFNPRLYGCLGVAAAAGAPLVPLWCADLLGQPVTPKQALPGIRWRMEDTDTRHILWLARNREYRAAALAARPRRHTTHAYFRTRDPMPLLARVVQLAQVRWEHVRAGD